MSNASNNGFLSSRAKSIVTSILVKEWGNLSNFCRATGLSNSSLTKALSPVYSNLASTVEVVLLEQGRLNNVLRFEYAVRDKRSSVKRYFEKSKHTPGEIIGTLRGEFFVEGVLREFLEAGIIDYIPGNINELRIPIRSEKRKEAKAEYMKKLVWKRERDRLKKWEKRIAAELKDVRSRIAALEADEPK